MENSQVSHARSSFTPSPQQVDFACTCSNNPSECPVVHLPSQPSIPTNATVDGGANDDCSAVPHSSPAFPPFLINYNEGFNDSSTDFVDQRNSNARSINRGDWVDDTVVEEIIALMDDMKVNNCKPTKPRHLSLAARRNLKPNALNRTQISSSLVVPSTDKNLFYPPTELTWSSLQETNTPTSPIFSLSGPFASIPLENPPKGTKELYLPPSTEKGSWSPLKFPGTRTWKASSLGKSSGDRMSRSKSEQSERKRVLPGLSLGLGAPFIKQNKARDTVEKGRKPKPLRLPEVFDLVRRNRSEELSSPLYPQDSFSPSRSSHCASPQQKGDFTMNLNTTAPRLRLAKRSHGALNYRAWQPDFEEELQSENSDFKYTFGFCPVSPGPRTADGGSQSGSSFQGSPMFPSGFGSSSQSSLCSSPVSVNRSWSNVGSSVGHNTDLMKQLADFEDQEIISIDDFSDGDDTDLPATIGPKEVEKVKIHRKLSLEALKGNRGGRSSNSTIRKVRSAFNLRRTDRRDADMTMTRGKKRSGSLTNPLTSNQWKEDPFYLDS